MKTPIKIFITGGIIFCLLAALCFKGFFTEYGVSKTEIKLLQIHKELYNAKQLSIKGDFAMASEEDKPHMEAYLDNETNNYYLMLSTNGQNDEGFMKLGNRILTTNGDDQWRETDDASVGYYLRSVFKSIVAKNLMEMMSSTNEPKEITIDPIKRTITIKDVKVFTDLMSSLTMESPANIDSNIKETSNLTIHQNLTGGIDKIVIDLKMNIKDMGNEAVTGTVEVKINEPQEITLPANIAPKPDYGYGTYDIGLPETTSIETVAPTTEMYR